MKKLFSILVYTILVNCYVQFYGAERYLMNIVHNHADANNSTFAEHPKKYKFQSPEKPTTDPLDYTKTILLYRYYQYC